MSLHTEPTPRSLFYKHRAIQRTTRQTLCMPASMSQGISPLSTWQSELLPTIELELRHLQALRTEVLLKTQMLLTQMDELSKEIEARLARLSPHPSAGTTNDPLNIRPAN